MRTSTEFRDVLVIILRTTKKIPAITTAKMAASPAIIFGSLFNCSIGESFFGATGTGAEFGGSRFSVDSNGRLSTIN